MLKSHHPKRNESLAEYYYRTNRHLLGKTKVAEYDPEQDELLIVGGNAGGRIIHRKKDKVYTADEVRQMINMNK